MDSVQYGLVAYRPSHGRVLEVTPHQRVTAENTAIMRLPEKVLYGFSKGALASTAEKSPSSITVEKSESSTPLLRARPLAQRRQGARRTQAGHPKRTQYSGGYLPNALRRRQTRFRLPLCDIAPPSLRHTGLACRRPWGELREIVDVLREVVALALDRLPGSSEAPSS